MLEATDVLKGVSFVCSFVHGTGPDICGNRSLPLKKLPPSTLVQIMKILAMSCLPYTYAPSPNHYHLI